MSFHITPGKNGWTSNAGKIARAINAKADAVQAEENAKHLQEQREIAELEYYEENNCYPRALGYFGTETDAHFNER